jgi:nitroreductase
VVKDTHLISQARDEYSRIKLNLGLESYGYETNTSSFSPYPLSQRPQSTISFDQLHSLFLRRRSVRWYLQKPVPEELIRKAINSAALAPSACNRQPYRFIVANVPALAARIAECAGGTGGFAHQVPSIIVVIGDLSAYPKERDRHLIYIDASLVSMQLMLAAETLGLSTCPINWPDVNSSEKKIQALLRLPEYERVIMLIAIGFGDPKSGIPYSQKKQDSLIMQMYSEP